MVNIKDFDSSLLKLHKNSFQGIAIYYIGYITKKDKYAINSANPLHLIVHEVDRFIEKNEGSKYLNFAFTNINSEVLKKFAEIWSGIEDQIKAIVVNQGNMEKIT